ncbi:phosphotransferase [Microbacterium sp. NPDC019599]|uniref:phosphotransferase n=1 Tax=Microbacterium sp. NPDC019599 TaxID=3154690 RepID=UPI0033E73B68
MDEPEIPLHGGNATAGVVRVGGTVRKPWTSSTDSVSAFLTRLAAAGLDVPEVLGRDEQGRQIIEFIPGTLAEDARALTIGDLERVGRMVRDLHEASAGFEVGESSWTTLIHAPGADLICHNDLAPWNLIMGERWVFIDWDAAGPSTRLWDLAYAAQAFTLNDAAQLPVEAAGRLAAFVHGYDADATLRAQLPDAMAQRTEAMHELLRQAHEDAREPWATMYVEGHGAHWRTVSGYIRRHKAVWQAALAPSGV